jgi:hypothetical protein
MLNAKTFKEFLPFDKCQYLIEAVTSTNIWESGGSEFWDNRVVNYRRLERVDRVASNILLDVNLRCKDAIKEAYGLDKEVYADTLQVIRWFEGMSQPPHADDMSNTDIEGFEHRVFGSILYLNADYSGGHTYYPNFNFEVVPEPGMLAVHPGDPEHLHGVTKIENGMRYTIASFWTFEKDRGHDWSIPQ